MRSLEETPFMFITTEEAVRSLVADLLHCNVISVNVIQHSYRSYLGYASIIMVRLSVGVRRDFLALRGLRDRRDPVPRFLLAAERGLHGTTDPEGDVRRGEQAAVAAARLRRVHGEPLRHPGGAGAAGEEAQLRRGDRVTHARPREHALPARRLEVGFSRGCYAERGR